MLLKRMLNVLINIFLRQRRRRLVKEGRCTAWACRNSALPDRETCEDHPQAKKACCCMGCLTWLAGVIGWWYWETQMSKEVSPVFVWLDDNIITPIGDLLQEIAKGL